MKVNLKKPSLIYFWSPTLTTYQNMANTGKILATELLFLKLDFNSPFLFNFAFWLKERLLCWLAPAFRGAQDNIMVYDLSVHGRMCNRSG